MPPCIYAFALWLYISSHLKDKSVFSPLESGLGHVTCFGQQKEMKLTSVPVLSLDLKKSVCFCCSPLPSPGQRACLCYLGISEGWGTCRAKPSHPKQPKLDLTSPQTQKRAQLNQQNPADAGGRKGLPLSCCACLLHNFVAIANTLIFPNTNWYW